MQKMPWRGAHKRQLAAREVMPGYPWEGQFQSREEVDHYLAGDQVTCLLCGKPYVLLASHTKRVHYLAVEDYKVRFGIPQGRGVCGRGFAEKQAANVHASGFAALSCGYQERLPGRKQKPKPTWVKREMIARILPSVGRRTYDNFEWHFGVLKTVWRYRKVQPPQGQASWSQFKKRWLDDKELRVQMLAARSQFKSPYGAKP